MATIIFSLGGSLLFKNNRIDYKYIAEFTRFLKDMHLKGYKFGVVTGGGSIAREYISAASHFGATKVALDELAISITKSNARLVSLALGDLAYPNEVLDIDTAVLAIKEGYIPVMGGMVAGMTTDADAALLAESLNAHFINLTDVAGIYSGDPSQGVFDLYTHLSPEQLLNLAKEHDSRDPGVHFPLDLFACEIIRRSRIKTYVVDGRDLNNVKNILYMQPFKGTRID